MDNNTINSLQEALKHSPDNTPLRTLLADTLLNMNRLEEAEAEYAAIVKQSNDPTAKMGLVNVFLKKNNHSACILILEEMIEEGTDNAAVFSQYAKCLLKDNAVAKAVEAYKQALELNPDAFDGDLDRHLRQRSVEAIDGFYEDDDYEHTDRRFLQKPTINFDDVGGMATVKKEIDLKIIRPLLHPELYKAYGKKTGGGILLYGAPGCGKTFIAKATAGQVNAKFINVTLQDILDMYTGNSEKNLHQLFQLARKNTPCVLFFDEIDALAPSRGNAPGATSRLVTQFLQELDGIESANDGLLVIGATNAPWSLDTALRRPGRFDRIIFVPPPDVVSREAILRLKLKDKPTEPIGFKTIAEQTDSYSGADIDAIIDIAIERKLEDSFLDGIPKLIETADLIAAAKKHRPSTLEWFSTAKNYATFANEAGLYDDILTYLDRVK